MTALTLALWTPPHGGPARCYINGITAADKAYLVPGPHGGSAVHVTGAAQRGAAEIIRLELIQALILWGVAPTDAEALRWDKVLQVAGVSRGRRAPAPASVFPNDRVARSQDTLRRHPDSNMTVASIPIEVPVVVRVDHREPQAMVEALRQAQNTTVEVTTLAVGDYEVLTGGKRILIERKAGADFQNSIKVELRLFDEIERMTFEDLDHAVLIMEGVDPNGANMLPQACTGAITCVGFVQSVNVIQTLDYNHSAYAISKLSHHAGGGLGYELPLHQLKSKNRSLIDQRTYVLQSLPGVSGELAARLLDHFGSVKAVVNATDKQLREVPGLGDKRVAQILAALGAD